MRLKLMLKEDKYMNYYCSACGKEYSDKELIWRCSCGAYLSCKSEEVLRKEDVIKDRFSL